MAEDGAPRPPCPTNAHPCASRCEAHCLVFHPPAPHEAQCSPLNPTTGRRKDERLTPSKRYFSSFRTAPWRCCIFANGKTEQPLLIQSARRTGKSSPSQGTEAHSVLLLKDLVRPCMGGPHETASIASQENENTKNEPPLPRSPAKRQQGALAVWGYK